MPSFSPICLKDYQKSTVNSFNWLLSGSEWARVIRELTGFLLNSGKVLPKEGYQLIRRSSRRWIFRYTCREGPVTEFVVKAFPLKTLRLQIKHRRYGWREFTNLLVARQKGIPAPYPYAYGE
jgi:hypothetical protein